jgi:RNA polymerase sigma-70 factor (ECF subfamily)
VNCSDEALFSRAQHGEQYAFEILVQRYQDRVYSMSLKILHNSHDAQDVAQQSFLQVWRKRKVYNSRWKFSTWLYRIVTNICIDEHRRRQRRPTVPEETLTSVPVASSPAQDYEHLERRNALTAALGQVPVEDRIVILLCYMEGLSYGDIARIRGISVHTVKNRLRRAKALLRQHLEDYREAKS